MSIRNIFKSKVFWAVGAKGLNIAGGFILLPIVVHYLDKETLSLYFLFASLATITSILDFGFNSTLTRNFAYAYAGAKRIESEGVCHEFNNDTNWHLIGEIYVLAKKIYFYLSIICLTVFFIPGSWYIYLVIKKSSISIEYGMICWLIYSFAAVLAMYFVYLSTLIQGRGDVNLANQITILSRFISILISIVMLINGYGLLSICVSTLSVCIIERILYLHFAFNDQNHIKLKQFLVNSDKRLRELFNLISKNSIKFGIISVGTYLITRATIILSTTYLGLQASASYIFTVQVVSIIVGIASSIIGVYLPKLNQLTKQPDKQFSLFCFSNLLSLLIYIISAMALIIFGNMTLTIIHSKTHLLNTSQIVSLLIIYLLEVQHSNYATMITTDNRVPFVGAAIYSGIAIVVLSILSLRYTNLGTWGLIISQGLVQLAYNNWYWIVYICKKYKVSYLDTIQLGLNYAKDR